VFVVVEVDRDGDGDVAVTSGSLARAVAGLPGAD